MAFFSTVRRQPSVEFNCSLLGCQSSDMMFNDVEAFIQSLHCRLPSGFVLEQDFRSVQRPIVKIQNLNEVVRFFGHLVVLVAQRIRIEKITPTFVVFPKMFHRCSSQPLFQYGVPLLRTVLITVLTRSFLYISFECLMNSLCVTKTYRVSTLPFQISILFFA